MNKLIFLAIFGTFFSSRAAMAQDFLPKERIAVFGDEHVEGFGHALWVKAKEALLGCQYMSRPGTRAENWIDDAKLHQWLIKFDPQTIVIVFGTNEARSNRRIVGLAAAFQSLADQVSKHGKRKIVWIAPPSVTGVPYLAEVREALGRVKNIEIVDLSGNEYGLKDDGIRLNPAAYRIFAWDIWSELNKRKESVILGSPAEFTPSRVEGLE